MESVSQSEADDLLDIAITVLNRMEEREIVSRPHNQPVPRGTMSVGEALTLVAALIAILAELYPDLVADDVIDLAATYYRTIQ